MTTKLTLRNFCQRVSEKTGYDYADVRIIIDSYVGYLYHALRRSRCILGYYYSFTPDMEKEAEWPAVTRSSYALLLAKRAKRKKAIRMYLNRKHKKQKLCQLSQMKPNQTILTQETLTV